ncbi:hypothetical protein [Lacinutrix sp. 5H-3-7-4]|uniref:hypothetical protein n=1 Tax=Lacinutrix sp. (strain 5H-3-7-4) TaxID=983544 RepID=UPI00020A3791|nr:hypothetical protein [Lacinutrix sp. 5H-3-7-4]AEG99960.1 hypothetical protein Lacal_0108 [Lacinutrix sp. 5H-3-7-4]
MKKFIKYIVLIFLVVIAVLFILDICYTNVYLKTQPRNKTQYILSLDEKTNLDYVFLGSSRVENFIMPSIIKEETNKEAINLGTQGANLDDVNIFLRLLIDQQIKIERLFVQVDYIYNIESNSDIVRSQILPYLRSNTIINNYLKRTDSNYNKNYYIPFYRYATNDYRIGFREFFASLINKKSKIDFSDGFIPLYNSIQIKEKHKASLPKRILESNGSLVEIDSLCTANNINVTYFCAPYCSGLKPNGYLTKLEEKLSDFHDFSRVIKEDSLFENCGHVNKNGAKVFTTHFIRTLDL